MTTFGSVCSGIEAASVAWHPLGWKASWLAEISKFPSELLAHYYPDVPNLGDMTTIADLVKKGSVDAPDVFVGGTPCQAFSFAGLRNSLDDARGNLTLEFARIADAIDDKRMDSGREPAVIVWENVPGVLNTKDNAFGCFLGLLAGAGGELQPTGKRWSNAGCVYGKKRTVAWRILDAQYFGVAQRRRRVFVVASAGGIDPCEVLFERGGVSGNIAQSEGSWKDIAGTFTACSFAGDAGGKPDGAAGGHFQPVLNGMTVFREGGFADYVGDEVGTLRSSGGACGNGSENLVIVPCPTMVANSKLHAVAIRGNVIGRKDENGGNGLGCDENISPTLTSTDVHAVAFQSSSSFIPCGVDITPTLGAQNANAMAVANKYQIRRLTPVECERLQGFPDVKKNVKIRACLDHQNPSASAETQCLKLPNNARSAEPGASPPSASVAGQSSSTSPPSQSGRVAVNVQIDLERMHLHLHSVGRLLLSVSLAEPQSRYPLLTQLGNIAPLLVQVLANLERTTTAGRAASHPHTNPSLHQLNGSPFVELSGQEIGEFANDAETFTKKASAFTKFITSQAGQSFLSCSETLRTLCCFATAAISLCIQEKTNWASSYEISIDLVQGYTNVPFGNRMASDAQRYHALGNSMAVPVMRWIGEQIIEKLKRTTRKD